MSEYQLYIYILGFFYESKGCKTVFIEGLMSPLNSIVEVLNPREAVSELMTLREVVKDELHDAGGTLTQRN